MNPEQLKAALRSAGYLVMSEGGGGYGSEPGDPFIPGPTTYYYYGPRGRTTASEAAAAAGVPEAALTSMESRLVATPEESSSLYPSQSGGFFSMLTDLVTSPQFLMAASVVAPSILAAEAAGAAAAAAAPAANTGAGLIDASLGQAYADLGVGASAPTVSAGPSIATQPITTSPLSVFTEPGMATANMLAADAAGLAVPANAFVPSATTGAIPAYSSGLTSSGLTNFIDPFNPPLSYTSPFAPPTAGVGGAAFNPAALAGDTLGASLSGLTSEQIATVLPTTANNAAATAASVNALSPEALAALDAGLGGVPASAATGAGAAGAGANALANIVSPGEGIDTSIGEAYADLGVGAGLSTGAFDALAKFAKDYGVPLSSLISGITGSQAAKSAADVQAQSAREARELAKQIYEKQVSLQEPFRTAGITAQNQLLTLLGLQGGTPGAEFGRYARPFGMQDFQADPGYAFRLSEGLKALEASRAARGGLLSGATGKALSRYGQDLASQEYGNAFNRYQTERVNRLQPLGALMGAGQAAAAGQAGYAGQYGQTAGGLTTDIGAARAAGDVGAANAITNALGQYARYASGQNLANQQIRQSMYGAAIPV
jgi:hypothetical protein